MFLGIPNEKNDLLPEQGRCAELPTSVSFRCKAYKVPSFICL